MLQPKRMKHRKFHRGKRRGIETRGTEVSFGEFGLQALETTWIEAIEDVDLDDLNPESLWRFRIRDFGPLRVAMDSHGGSLYDAVDLKARDKRAAVLATLGVKSR